MKKKPALQTILDNLDDYSVEQLETIPGQPLWIRQQLVKIKTHTHVDDRRAQAAASALTMEHPQLLFPDQMEIRVWVGSTQWVETKGLQLEINPGDLFLLLDPSQSLVLVDHSAVRIAHWDAFLSQSQSKGLHSKQVYLSMCSERRNGSAPLDVPVFDGSNNSPLSQFGVRFK